MSVYYDRTVTVPDVKGVIRCRADNNKVRYRLPLGYTNPEIDSARPCIGYMLDKDPERMYPTSLFKVLFPEIWEKEFKDTPQPAVKKFGFFGAVKAINIATTIKDILDASVDVHKSNKLMDFAMYSILTKSNVAEGFCAHMADFLLFSDHPYSDSAYSDLFKRGISWGEITTFKIGWAKWCVEQGYTEVYICIDGSNDDCSAKGVEFAERGKAKSHKNKRIVSFTYAVTEEGFPVTYQLYRGGKVDAKAMFRVITFLEDLGFKVKGVILDRGYCDVSVFTFLRVNKIKYVVMVKGKPDGFQTMYEECGDNLKFKGSTFVIGTKLFAIQRKVKLFKKSTHEDFLTIFFSFENAAGEISTFLDKVNKEYSRLKKQLAMGNSPEVTADLNKILLIQDVKKDDGTLDHKDVFLDYAEFENVIDQKGLYSILTSEEMPPSEVDRLYNCRDASEKTYSILKSQLGYGTVRIYCTKGVQTSFFVAFIASIIRFMLQQVSISLGVDTNRVIGELRNIQMERIIDQYTYTPSESTMQKKVFKALKVDDNFLMDIVKETNNRVLGVFPKPKKRKTGPKPKSKSTTEGAAAEAQEQPKKKTGPRLGTKKNAVNKDGTPRKKPGPKPGFKRGVYNKDGSERQKPGPKNGSHHTKK